MPLLTSPINGSPMKQISRYGIEIDVCPTTGGIWLDKGELEKLMALLKEEAMNDQRAPNRHEKDESYAYHNRDKYDDDDDDYYKHSKGGYKQKSKMSRVMDIFDF